MRVQEIANVLNAQWLCGEDCASMQVSTAFASDMMSVVLAFVQEDTLLLTGLINSQAVRTAEMLDLPCLVFVRGKNPHQDAIERARALGIAALLTPYSMFEACGRLYMAGLQPVRLGEDDD